LMPTSIDDVPVWLAERQQRHQLTNEHGLAVGRPWPVRSTIPRRRSHDQPARRLGVRVPMFGPPFR